MWSPGRRGTGRRRVGGPRREVDRGYGNVEVCDRGARHRDARRVRGVRRVPAQVSTYSRLLRPARDAHEVDAVAVPVLVGQVVAQMRAIHRNGLAVGQHADVVPVHLVISKRRPAVHPRFLDELFKRATFRSGEELVARVRVVEGDLARRLAFFLEEGRLLPVARELGVVPVVAADLIRRLRIHVPPEVLGGAQILAQLILMV